MGAVHSIIFDRGSRFWQPVMSASLRKRPNFASARNDARCHYQTSLSPEATFAHINLGVVQRELGDWASARAAFERAVEAAPDRTDLKLELASIVERQGQLGEAEAMYANLVKTNPELENAWFRLGYLRLQLADPAASIPAFEACITHRPMLIRRC